MAEEMNVRAKFGTATAAMAILAVIILVITAIPSPAQADGVVSIYNAPPTFVSVKIQDTGSRIVVVVEVSDYNGWENIYRVDLNVTDSYGNVIESASYLQYPNNESDQRIDEFRDLKGGVLLPQECDVERFPYQPPSTGGWGPDWFNATYQRVTFVFKPFSGYRIMLRAYDKKMAYCENIVPFSSEYRVPPVIDNPSVSVGISLIVSILAGVAIYMHRRSSNKLAQIAEEKIGG